MIGCWLPGRCYSNGRGRLRSAQVMLCLRRFFHREGSGLEPDRPGRIQKVEPSILDPNMQYSILYHSMVYSTAQYVVCKYRTPNSGLIFLWCRSQNLQGYLLPGSAQDLGWGSLLGTSLCFFLYSQAQKTMLWGFNKGLLRGMVAWYLGLLVATWLSGLAPRSVGDHQSHEDVEAVR